jgi:hypothetical protein
MSPPTLMTVVSLSMATMVASSSTSCTVVDSVPMLTTVTSDIRPSFRRR